MNSLSCSADRVLFYDTKKKENNLLNRTKHAQKGMHKDSSADQVTD